MGFRQGRQALGTIKRRRGARGQSCELPPVHGCQYDTMTSVLNGLATAGGTGLILAQGRAAAAVRGPIENAAEVETFLNEAEM